MTQRLTRSVCGSRRTVASMSEAVSAVVGRSCATRPPSSAGPTSARTCRIQGKDAAIVAGVSRTPGRISRANARVGGKERLRASNARSAWARVGGSWRIVVRRLFCSAANAPIVVLKLEISPWSWDSLRPRPADVFWRPARSLERSSGSMPRTASLITALLRRASAEYV